MGINDLQAQINRMNSMVTRFRAQIGSLTAQVQLAEQNAATTNAWFPNAFVGAGDGGTTYGSGNGIDITSGEDPELISVELASTDSGLHFPSAQLAVEVESGGGIDINGVDGLRIDFDGATEINGELDETSGGTGQNIYAPGDILYAGDSTTLDVLSGGLAKQILCMDGDALYPVWVDTWNVAGDTGMEAVNMDETLTVKGGTGIETEVTELIGGDKQVEVTLKDIDGVDGSYTNSNITVDAQGRITTASTGSAGGSTGGNPTAEVKGTKTDGVAVTFMRSDAAPKLQNTAVTAASYTNSNITVDPQGRITAASDGSALGTVTEVDAGLGLYTEPAAGITTTGTISVNPGNAISLSVPPDSTVDVDIFVAPAFPDDTLDREDEILAADVDDEPSVPSKKVKFKEMDMTFFTGETSNLYGTDTGGDVQPIAFGTTNQVLVANGTALPSFKDAPNRVVWGKLTGDFVTARMAGDNPPFGNAKWCTAIRQETDAATNTLVEAEDVMVFTLGLHNAFRYENSRVSMVKDDVFTDYKNDGKDWYRLTDSPIAQEVYCRLKVHPYVDLESNPSWLAKNGEFYVYRNEKYNTTSGSEPIPWSYTDALVGNSNDEWDVRLRTGHPLNAKDMYRGQFWPDEDLLIVDQTACIMALVGASEVIGSVGCFSWGSDPIADTNYYYPMGKRFSIIGQFTADVAKGASEAFRLLKWDGDDFAQETIYGTKADGYDTGSPGDWDIQFAEDAVVNAAGFTIKGSASFDATEDIVACQYDEETGVYLAAPLRCTS